MLLRHLEDPKDDLPKVIEFAVLESRLLNGERILLAFEKKFLQKLKRDFPGVVIYFPPEIDELYKHKNDKEFVKLVHFAKKEFEGWIVPKGNKGDDDV